MNIPFPEMLLWLSAISTGAALMAWGITTLSKALSAAWKHLFWLLALIAPLVAFPLLVANIHLDLPVFSPAEMPSSPASAASFIKANPSEKPPISTFVLREPTHSPILLIKVVWMTISLILAVLWMTAHIRMRGILGRAQPISKGSRLEPIVAQALGDRTHWPVLLSIDPEIPYCYGFLNPTIVLPFRSLQWSEEKLRACLLHEKAHLMRNDLLSSAISQISCATFWFNPLVWVAAAQLRNFAEIAADDFVISKEMPPESFAANLLAISEEIRGASMPNISLSMARSGYLKKRLTSILDETANRNVPQRALLVSSYLFLLAALTFITSVRLVAAPEQVAKTPPQSSNPSSAEKSGSRTIQNTNVVTSEDLAQFMGLKVWKTRVALPAGSYAVTINEIKNGKIAGIFLDPAPRPRAADGNGLVVMFGAIENGLRLTLTLGGNTMYSDPKKSPNLSAFAYPDSLPKEIGEGDYVLGGEMLPDRDTATDDITAYAKGFVLRVRKIETGQAGTAAGRTIVPEAEKRPDQGREFIVSLKKNGSIVANGKVVTEDQLKELISERARESPDAAVILKGDKEVDYKRVVAVLDLCKAARIWNIAFATSQAE